MQVPALNDNFYEFVEIKERHRKNHKFLTMQQLQIGKHYYIVVTSQNGLYRYDINDIVTVIGHYNHTPCIRFVQKGAGVVSLTGEKLYEAQLIQVMSQFNARLNASIAFFLMLGCPQRLQYVLYIEYAPCAIDIEAQLSQINREFRDKRRSGRLLPLQIQFVLPGTGEAYKRYCIQQGQREAQFKMKHLQYLDDCGFDFSH